jgi:hypothetical protein
MRKVNQTKRNREGFSYQLLTFITVCLGENLMPTASCTFYNKTRIVQTSFFELTHK